MALQAAGDRLSLPLTRPKPAPSKGTGKQASWGPSELTLGPEASALMLTLRFEV